MGKRISTFLSLFLIIVVTSIFSSFNNSHQPISKEVNVEKGGIVLTQNTEKEGKKEEADSHFILILKQLREMVDAWLKSLNERIESEDITRFEVRFLEILRNILEWVKEKIDSKIESSEERKPEKKERGLFRETYQRYSPLSVRE